MEPKHISCDQSPSPLTGYESFIAQNLEYHNQRGINELRERRIRACFHGWVILSDHSDNILWSLWNPLTSKLIHLPSLIHKERDSYECCLSSPPDDQGSVFLLLRDEIPTIVFCRLDCKRKKLKWTEMTYAKQLQSLSGLDDCFLECPTCCNGKVYAMCLDGDYRFIIQIDIVVRGKEVLVSLLPFVKAPSFNLHTGYCFLKGSCTELFYIEACFKDGITKTRISEVCLFKLDMTCMIWKEMEVLKDAVFFIQFATDNSYSVFYKSAVASEIAGCVYILDEMDKITLFHVKDITMSIFSMPWIVRESQVLVWAMLECRLEVDHPKSKPEEEYKYNEIIKKPVQFDSTSESHLLSIPDHVLKMIMELCVGVEYMSFRATCKRCSLAAPLVKWSNKTSLRRLQKYSLVSPWLMVFSNYQDTMTFIDPLCGDTYYIKTPQELNDGYRVYCSRYGWLLMYNLLRPLVFFNPFTSDIHMLPQPETNCLQSLCFSAPPTSPDCMVAGFTRLHGHLVEICIIHFVSQEEPSWRIYRLDFGSSDPYSFHFPTFSGRDMYVLCNNGKKIEAFRNIGLENFFRKAVVNKAPGSCCRSRPEYFLSKCDQHLLLVIVGEFGESVEVFKLNSSRKEWEKIDGLGKHMIYISDASCICLEAKSPEMENKIYFPRVLHNDYMKIVFYSLETCKYHTFDNKNIQESFGVDLLKTKYYRASHTWIEPSWS